MPPLVLLAIQQAPWIINRLREAFAVTNPNDPPPTDAEVIAAYEAAFKSSLAKDDVWLALHPK